MALTTVAWPRSSTPHWGFVRSGVSRFGASRRRLVVLAPGATAQDYRLFRVAEEILWAAPLAALLALPAAAALVGPIAGTFVVVAGAAVGVLAVRRRSARTRAGAHVLEACCTEEPSPASETLSRAAVELREAERRLRAGAIDAIEFEVAWAAAWNRLGDGSDPA